MAGERWGCGNGGGWSARSRTRAPLLATLFLISTGCNAILLSGKPAVTVNTNPPGLTAAEGRAAEFGPSLANGIEVTTPGVLRLARDVDHTITIKRAAAAIGTATVHSRQKAGLWLRSFLLNTLAFGWWNLGIGTVVGVVVDAASGYTKGLDTENVDIDLRNVPVPSTTPPPVAPPTAVTTAPTAPSTGGPITDTDRAAARDLFNEGVSLQASRPAEALDRFQRSMAVFSAPTTGLHIAQCKAAIGKLVEAGETYRAVINMKIPQGSSQAFFDAQAAAQREVEELDARIPRVKLVVEGGSATRVTIDGEPINLVLLGVARPIDPGKHKVTATGPGIGAEQTFEIREREQRDVVLVMKKM